MVTSSTLSLSTAKPATRQERVQRKEDVIIGAARDVFLERGFKGATMAQIARGSGVADGTLYTYFQNKEALAWAVVADFYKRLTDSAQAGVDAISGCESQLRFLAKHHLTHVLAERRILEMMPLIDMHLEDYEGSELFDLNKNYVVIFNRITKDGQARGDIKPHFTPWILRDIFFGGIDYGCRTMLIKGRGEDVDAFVDQVIDMIMTPSAVEADPVDSAVTRLEKAASRMEAILDKADI